MKVHPLSTLEARLRSRGSRSVTPEQLADAEARVWEKLSNHSQTMESRPSPSTRQFHSLLRLGSFAAVCAVALIATLAYPAYKASSVINNRPFSQTPDTSIAVRFTGQDQSITVANIDESTVKRLSAGTFGYLRTNNVQAEASSAIAYASTPAYTPVIYVARDKELVRIDLSTRKQQVIYRGENRIDYDPQFHSGAQQVLLNTTNLTTQLREIIIIDAQSGSVLHTVAGDTNYWYAMDESWSPDGSKIALVGSTNNRMVLRVINTTTWETSYPDLSQTRYTQPSAADGDYIWKDSNTLGLLSSPIPETLNPFENS